jgi:hypothetical protein
MLETGRRVGDAIRFEPAAPVKGEHLWIYTFVPQKKKKIDQPKPMETYLSDRLKTAIDQCEWLSPERPFLYGAFRNAAYLGNEVYYRMQTIGERCGVADCRPIAYGTHSLCVSSWEGFSLMTFRGFLDTPA